MLAAMVILTATTTHSSILAHMSASCSLCPSTNWLPAMQVITSCNSTQEELCKEFGQSTQHSLAAAVLGCEQQQGDVPSTQPFMFQYVDHVKTYPKFKFAGMEGTKVCTVAFRRLEVR